jgi:hypothetical protein
MIRRFNAVQYGLSNRLNSYPKEVERCGSGGQKSAAKNHYFGRFDESGRGLALFQPHLAGSIGGDDRSDVLASDGERYLCQQSFYLEVDNSAYELISAADMPKLGTAFRCHILPGGTVQMAIQFVFRDAVVPASGLHRAQLFAVDPAF